VGWLHLAGIMRKPGKVRLIPFKTADLSEGHPWVAGRGYANFRELRHGEVRSVPGAIGENFSGSCTVTSRNPLIHDGPTSPRISISPSEYPYARTSWTNRL